MTIVTAAPTRRLVGALLVTAGLVLLALANWHLVHVASVSQPDCVPHLRQAADGQAGQFRAAVSSCSIK
jgi:hypothetical protein